MNWTIHQIRWLLTLLAPFPVRLATHQPTKHIVWVVMIMFSLRIRSSLMPIPIRVIANVLTANTKTHWQEFVRTAISTVWPVKVPLYFAQHARPTRPLSFWISFRWLHRCAWVNANKRCILIPQKHPHNVLIVPCRVKLAQVLRFAWRVWKVITFGRTHARNHVP